VIFIMIKIEQGTVLEVKRTRAGCSEIVVRVDGAREAAKAISYDIITGTPRPGDRVWLNTTAVRLGLGSGGYHFVLHRNGPISLDSRCSGHIMKLRYTPYQLRCLSVEEQTSPHHELLRDRESLAGVPVVVFELHSQLLPVVLGIRSVRRAARVAYVMTDGGALPVQFSEVVHLMRREGLLATVVTAGHAFGGDLEAVNVYSGLLAAKEVGGAEVIVVGIGPGIVGTGTKLGHPGVDQGIGANAVCSLDGRAILTARVSFADPRPRHRGISHHTVTVLRRVVLASVRVALPDLSGARGGALRRQAATLPAQHELLWVPEEECAAALEGKSDWLPVMRTMGRTYREDREFFLASAAAGIVAAGYVDGRAQDGEDEPETVAVSRQGNRGGAGQCRDG